MGLKFKRALSGILATFRLYCTKKNALKDKGIQ